MAGLLHPCSDGEPVLLLDCTSLEAGSQQLLFCDATTFFLKTKPKFLLVKSLFLTTFFSRYFRTSPFWKSWKKNTATGKRFEIVWKIVWVDFCGWFFSFHDSSSICTAEPDLGIVVRGFTGRRALGVTAKLEHLWRNGRWEVDEVGKSREMCWKKEGTWN